jgi:putative hydrolase of the HAD superfamily
VGALLFDLGGVVFTIDFNRAFARWAALSGERIDTIGSRFSFDAAYQRHERGEISITDYLASLRSSLCIDLSDDAFVDGWTAIYAGEIAETVALLHRLKARVPLYAFTNSNPTHPRVWATRYAETLRCFRNVFVSSEMGTRKPERAAFQAVASAIGVPLAGIVFFDDTLENVEGARAAGMRAIHARSVADIERTLAEWRL